ncbi:MAG: hypothetical protein K6T16_01545 [Candidatus Pacearchaeota archaeon]|nr:hypothetical protein [Candidatus Pacearchaeota archaeon]
MEEDIIRKLVETRKEEAKKIESPETAKYNYPIEKFQIPELPLLSDVDKLPEKYNTDLDIKKVISFNLVYDRDNNRWVFAEATNGGGSGGSALKKATIINLSVPPFVWTKIADLPNNVGSWTIKSQDNNFIFKIKFDEFTSEHITLNAGVIWSEDTNPKEIWVIHEQMTDKIFELIYWTPN